MRTRALVFLTLLAAAWMLGCMTPAATAQHILAPVPHDQERLPAAKKIDPPAEPVEPKSGLSGWITYHRPCCTGELGGNLIASELFLRSGVSAPYAGRNMGDDLQAGWLIQGGARVLFFNQDVDRAWTVEASVGNWHNHAHGSAHTLSVFVPNAFGISTLTDVDVTVREFNRTFVSLGLGRQWWLWGPADDVERMWRWGLDAGGRFGSSKADFNEIRHRTDVIGGVYAAAHTDLEFPCGSCVFMTGLRLEWAYTWSDILQRESNVAEVNLMLTLGVRF